MRKLTETKAAYRLFAAEVHTVEGAFTCFSTCIDPLTRMKVAEVEFNTDDEIYVGDFVHVAQFDDGTFGVAGKAVENPFPSSGDYRHAYASLSTDEPMYNKQAIDIALVAASLMVAGLFDINSGEGAVSKAKELIRFASIK